MQSAGAMQSEDPEEKVSTVVRRVRMGPWEEKCNSLRKGIYRTEGGLSVEDGD